MANLSRWLAPATLAVGLGFGAMTPATAQAQDLTRVLVDIADVVLRGGQPYYRNGDYGQDDRLIAQRDRYGRVVYYRNVPRYPQQHAGPPYGKAYGYYENGPGKRGAKCNKHGKCKVTYYDPRHDRSGYDDRDSYDRYYGTRGSDYRVGRHDDDRYWDGRRWRERDDD